MLLKFHRKLDSLQTMCHAKSLQTTEYRFNNQTEMQPVGNVLLVTEVLSGLQTSLLNLMRFGLGSPLEDVYCIRYRRYRNNIIIRYTALCGRCCYGPLESHNFICNCNRADKCFWGRFIIYIYALYDFHPLSQLNVRGVNPGVHGVVTSTPDFRVGWSWGDRGRGR